MTMTLAQAHALLPASTLVGDGGVAFDRVHSDTRTIRAGDLFVALRGERYDGHDHLGAASAGGAAAALVERGLGGDGDVAALPGIVVADTLAALQQLAAAWRARLHLPLVAVTGSNGKTTITQMVARMLDAWHPGGTLATAGNLNNHIGVPLTLLRLRQDDAVWHRAAVVELGTNHAGEIAQLARLAQPTVALVANAQREHQEFLVGVDAVARENGAVIDALGAGGVVVVPADDAYTAQWRAQAGARRVVTFGGWHGDRGATAPATADVTADGAWDAARNAWSLTLHTPFGSAAALLAQPGRHNVRNALAATACALAAGAPLAAAVQGLAAFVPVAGRSQALALRIGGRAVTLVDDSYNANPDSVLAAIAVLAELPRPRWLILGDMAEVGDEGPRFHAEVAHAARVAGIEHVWSAGAACTAAGIGRTFADVPALVDAIAVDTPDAAAIAVKGSRSMRMERVVRALQERADAA